MFEFSIDKYNTDNISLRIKCDAGESIMDILDRIECYRFDLINMSFPQKPDKVFRINRFQAGALDNSIEINLGEMNGMYKILIMSLEKCVGEIEEYIGNDIEITCSYDNISLNISDKETIDGVAIRMKSNTDISSNLITYKYKSGSYSYKLPKDLKCGDTISFFVGNINSFYELEFSLNKEICDSKEIFNKYLNNHIKFQV